MREWFPIWIAELQIEPLVEEKILRKHRISSKEVRWMFIGNQELICKRAPNYEQFGRLQVVDSRELLPRVMLIVEEVNRTYSTWRLITAIRTSNSKLVGR
jgi:hypothetical protein